MTDDSREWAQAIETTRAALASVGYALPIRIIAEQDLDELAITCSWTQDLRFWLRCRMDDPRWTATAPEPPQWVINAVGGSGYSARQRMRLNW